MIITFSKYDAKMILSNFYNIVDQKGKTSAKSFVFFDVDILLCLRFFFFFFCLRKKARIFDPFSFNFEKYNFEYLCQIVINVMDSSTTHQLTVYGLISCNNVDIPVNFGHPVNLQFTKAGEAQGIAIWKGKRGR